MFDLFLSRHQKTRYFTTVDPTSITAPSTQLVLSEPHYKKAPPMDQTLLPFALGFH